ncbi:MAG: response regulator, partial [Acidobacteriota bacterium]|nr:response regulator [Acidobacteriota bacterium]
GMDVIEANNGRVAVERFRERADTIDVVVMDLTMPEMDGEQAFREIRRVREDVPVIFSSGYGPLHFESALAGQSQVCFLRKPYLAETLVGALQQLL